MALWSNTDESASAPKHTVDVVTGNTGIQAYNLETTGTFAVDTKETRASGVNGHAGWILRKVGTGGRTGRVFEETLVAMGSISTDGSDDSVYPDTTISIITQPSNKSNSAGNSATFTVVATSTPTATLSYTWIGPQGEVGTDSATLTISNLESANAGGYYVTIEASGADDVVSANATLTVTE